jgi:hypothetical protein
MTSIPVFCNSIPALFCIKHIRKSNLEVGALVVMSQLRELNKIEGAAIEALYSAALNVRHLVLVAHSVPAIRCKCVTDHRP